MIALSQQHGEWIVQAERYRLIFKNDRPFVFVESARERLAELFYLSSVHPLAGRDQSYDPSEWVFTDKGDEIEATVSAKSPVWNAKRFRFRCTAQRFSYNIEVEGQGRLAEVQYFGGYFTGNHRWSSGFFWSGQQFQQIFNPEPNIPEVYHHPASSGSKIDLMGVPLPAKGDWFFTPPPFCFAGQYSEGWVGLGVEAAPGANQFTEYLYNGSHLAFYLTLSYEGHTPVDGNYALPAIGFDFASDEYEAIGAHVKALRAANLVPVPEVRETPAWWQTPIFCGWGAQCYLATLDSKPAPGYARQENYEHFIAALEANDVAPGIVVLDDKWQATYGDNCVDESKWPDVRGFIAEQHAKGRRVLLWLKAWDPEGVPADECVTHVGGEPIATDPSNPAFEKRFREAVQRMLSAEGYDADGFKIDFTARLPSGPHLSSYGNVWGLEMMRRYLEILYSEAKAIKPDALVMCHTPHPYLADVLDMIRLNDINIGTNVNRAMRHRARIASLACPEAIIDTDNWPITDKATWRNYLRIQPELGVPSLYFATHIDFTREPLDAEDYALIREAWAQLEAKEA